MDFKTHPLVFNLKFFFERFDNPVADKTKGSYVIRKDTKLKFHSIYLRFIPSSDLLPVLNSLS